MVLNSICWAVTRIEMVLLSVMMLGILKANVRMFYYSVLQLLANGITVLFISPLLMKYWIDYPEHIMYSLYFCALIGIPLISVM